MPIRYTGETIGTLTLCQKVKERNENGEYVDKKDKNGRLVYNKFPIQIRDSNAMATFLHVFKEEEPADPEKPWRHDLICFFLDEGHLKRCLKKCTFEDIFWGKLRNIKLNLAYPQNRKLLKYLMKDGYTVKCYRK